MQQNISREKGVPTVPIELTGRWIVWNKNHTRIIADGSSLAQAHKKAVATGEKHVWFDKVPAKAEYLGGAVLTR